MCPSELSINTYWLTFLVKNWPKWQLSWTVASMGSTRSHWSTLTWPWWLRKTGKLVLFSPTSLTSQQLWNPCPLTRVNQTCPKPWMVQHCHQKRGWGLWLSSYLHQETRNFCKSNTWHKFMRRKAEQIHDLKRGRFFFCCYWEFGSPVARKGLV